MKKLLLIFCAFFLIASTQTKAQDTLVVIGSYDTAINGQFIWGFAQPYMGDGYATSNSSGAFKVHVPVQPNVDGRVVLYHWTCNDTSYAFKDYTGFTGRDTITINLKWCDSACFGFKALFGMSDSLLTVKYTNLSSAGAGNFLWDFMMYSSSAATHIDSSTKTHPVYTYPNPGNAWTILTAEHTTSGCQDAYGGMVQIDTTLCGKFVGGFYQSVSNDSVFFSAAPSAGPVKYKWTFGDSSAPSTQQNPRHKYAAYGNYLVCLIVTDTVKGCTDTICRTISVPNPCASFVASFNHTLSGDSVFFNNLSTTGAVKYQWSFGNSTTSTLKNPRVKYAIGTYTVCLIVTDTVKGCIDTICKSVTVNPCLGFTANFTVKKVVYDSVYFTNTSSASSNKYKWTFGDGNTSTVKHPEHKYAMYKGYAVCLIAEDTLKGCSDTICKTVNITKKCTNFNATFTTATSGDSAFFTNSTFMAHTNAWNFGDGNTSNLKNPRHKYAAPGTYTVCLISRDTVNHCVDTTCKTVYINNLCSGFAANFYFSKVLDTAYFVNTSSGTADVFTWFFGDGDSGTGPNPRHKYANGTYTVCLVAKDTNTGCTDTVCKSLVMNICSGFSANFLPYNYIRTLTPTFTNYSSANANKFSWNFGNSTSSTAKNPSATYASQGAYTVCLIAEDTVNGCVDTICHQLYIDMTLGGRVTLDSLGIGADSAKVWLIRIDTVSSVWQLTAIDSTTTDSLGYYSFVSTSDRLLFVKAALTTASPHYSDYIPTYRQQSVLWSGAWFVTVFGADTFDINMVRGTNPGGPGFIGGLVSMGANKTGDPMADVEILVLSSAGVPVTYAYTNAAGEYTIPNLAYGTYRVLVEIPGKPSEEYTVTLNAANPGETNRNFDVNSKNITKSAAATGIQHLAKETLVLYPNPAATEVNIAFEAAADGDAAVVVTDITGKIQVAEAFGISAGKNKLVIDTEALSNGVYIISVNTQAGIYTGRVIINK